MTYKHMIELLEIEHECMLRKSHDVCDGNCCVCELVEDDYELHEMYINVISTLKAQEPRVLTLEELEHAEVAYAEDKDKTDIIPVLVLGKMCEHIALVKPHFDEEAITRMIIPRADEYGVRWRCWTSRPTDEQREAVKWE